MKTMRLSPEEVAAIQAMREAKAKDAASQWQPKRIEDWTDTEMCAAFAAIHKAAFMHVQGVLDDEWKYRSGGNDHALIETVLETLFGREVFDRMNEAMR